HRVAAAGDRRADHGHRQRAATGGCDPHRLSRADPLDGGRLRLRPAGRLHDAEPVRQGPARQLRRPEIHGRRSSLEEVPAIVNVGRAATTRGKEEERDYGQSETYWDVM